MCIYTVQSRSFAVCKYSIVQISGKCVYIQYSADQWWSVYIQYSADQWRCVYTVQCRSVAVYIYSTVQINGSVYIQYSADQWWSVYVQYSADQLHCVKPCTVQTNRGVYTMQCRSIPMCADNTVQTNSRVCI